MNRPVVSVIIPFYDNISWLEEAVDSVFCQTYKKYEIIVINDGSLENDTNFIEKFGLSIHYVKTANRGPASARNVGIRLAGGKYIAFLDSDDLWLPTKLEKQVHLMEEFNADWSHTNYFKFRDGENGKLIEEKLEKYSGYIFPMSLLSTHIATPCVMIRSSLLKNSPELRFQEKMRYGQDYFLWLSLSVERKLYLVPEPLSKVRLRGANANSRSRAHIQVRAQAWNELKSNRSNYFYSPKSNRLIRFLYRLCDKGQSFLMKLEKVTDNKQLIEVVSKILYLIPFLGFKSLRKIYSIK